MGADRRVVKRVAATVAALLAFPLLLEGGALGWEEVCYGTRIVDGQPDGLYLQRPGEAPRLRPGAELDGTCAEIHVNADGFRGPPLADPKPANGLRLWFAGGSTPFDIYAPDAARTWPAIAGSAVAAAHPDRAVEVVNAGVPGEVLDGNRARLQKDGPRLRPDVVVIYPGPNDLRAVFFRPGAVTGPRPLDRLALVRLLARVRQPEAARHTKLPARRLAPHEEARLHDAIAGIVRAARTLGAQPVLVTHALRIRAGTSGTEAQAALAEACLLLGVDGPSTLEAYDTVDRLTRQIGASEQVPVIDLRAAVPADATYWGDATHFAAPGSALAGQVAGEALTKLVGS